MSSTCSGQGKSVGLQSLQCNMDKQPKSTWLNSIDAARKDSIEGF